MSHLLLRVLALASTIGFNNFTVSSFAARFIVPNREALLLI